MPEIASIIISIVILVLSSIWKKGASTRVRVVRGLAIMPYVRPFIYTITLTLATLLFYKAAYTIPDTDVALSQLTRWFALCALTYLLLTLIPGLIRALFPSTPYQIVIIQTRRALGLSTFFLALPHASLAFFYNLSGDIIGILQYPPRILWALVASSMAFTIFSAMAISDLPTLTKRMGPLWKKLHKFVYLATILVLIHAYLIGSHLTNFSSTISVMLRFSSITILILELAATYALWKSRIALIAIIFLTSVALLYPPQIFAHTIKSTKDIGVLMHINPNDEPVTTTQSEILVSLFTRSDTSLETSLSHCACTLTITQDKTLLFSTPFTAPEPTPILYTFPKEGSYDVSVSGKPSTTDTIGFSAFDVTFSYYVKNTSNTGKITSDNKLMNWFPYVALFTGVWATLLWIDAVPPKKSP